VRVSLRGCPPLKRSRPIVLICPCLGGRGPFLFGLGSAAAGAASRRGRQAIGDGAGRPVWMMHRWTRVSRGRFARAGRRPAFVAARSACRASRRRRSPVIVAEAREREEDRCVRVSGRGTVVMGFMGPARAGCPAWRRRRNAIAKGGFSGRDPARSARLLPVAGPRRRRTRWRPELR